MEYLFKVFQKKGLIIMNWKKLTIDIEKDFHRMTSVALDRYANFLDIPTPLKEDRENYISLLAFAFNEKMNNKTLFEEWNVKPTKVYKPSL